MKTKLIQDYKVFEGNYNSQMPLLVEEGLIPLTFKEIMKYKVGAIKSKGNKEMYFWLNSYWDTSTGLSYFNKELIIIPNSELLININEESRLSNGSLISNEDYFNELKKNYEVIKRDEIISGKSLTKEQAKNHKIWNKLAEEDTRLLNEFVELIFAKTKEIYGYDENMGIYLPDDQEIPSIRSWYINSQYISNLGDLSNAADAWSDLNRSARLCGVSQKNFGSLLEEIARKSKISNINEAEKAFEFYNLNKELLK